MERRNNESKASVASDQVLMRMASRREDEIHDKLSKIQKACTSASPSRPNPTVVAGRPTGEHASMTVNPGKARSLGRYVFDTETRAVIPSIPPTIATKPMANVVSANRKLYYLASPHWSRYPDDPCFERYVPNLEVWESMPPFPSYDDFLEITDYAVCYGIILFSLCNVYNWNSKVLAFH
ncbi:hypothetical protein L3X38_028599 [Prunus dulcis]|uniref:Uncharacterized protein n=1 Tax=Prunus dulcis TaxID=3755 RepID=A0AAD4VS27_PRUDU|nr:hypothetical protein L3X38_028599 [Prunus dulcis]